MQRATADFDLDKETGSIEEQIIGQTSLTGDPYNDSDFSMVGTSDIDKEMAIFAQEEKDALQTPLNNAEIKKMESNSKSLLDEITSGLQTYGKDKFWRNKKFFVQHNGF